MNFTNINQYIYQEFFLGRVLARNVPKFGQMGTLCGEVWDNRGTKYASRPISESGWVKYLECFLSGIQRFRPKNKFAHTKI